MGETESSRLSRKEREFMRHRGEILVAAEAVFSERGYVSATMEEIAQRAEFAVGTIYKFFQNKAGLYAEAMMTRMLEMEREVYEVLKAGTAPDEKIQRYFQTRIDQFWDNPSCFRLFFAGPVGTIGNANLSILPEILERYEELLRHLQSIFQEGIRETHFKSFPPDLLTLALEGLLGTYVEKLTRTENPVRDPKEERNLFQLFLQGVVP